MNVHIVSANPALQMKKTDTCGGMQTQKNPTCEIQVFWTCGPADQIIDWTTTFS
jgi:hypothetical protein